MKDENKTKKQLINELLELRQRIAELEKSEKEPNRQRKLLGKAKQDTGHFLTVPFTVYICMIWKASSWMPMRLL